MPPSKANVRGILERFKKLEQEKNVWLPLFQTIGEFVTFHNQTFTAPQVPGQLQNGRVFDGTAFSANMLMASALLGALWPNGAKTFKIVPPSLFSEQIEDTKEVKDYYEFVTRQMTTVMDKPEAFLGPTLMEYFTGQGSFGTSGVGVFDNDDPDVPVLYKSYGVWEFFIDEGANGQVDTVYTKTEYTLLQAAKKFGLKTLSARSQEAFKAGKTDDKITVIHCIEPRFDRDPFKYGAKDMPVASIHIEQAAEHVLKESGYPEMPVFITRFWKSPNEKYGRSPAMAALPDIMEINGSRNRVGIAEEKTLSPPLYVIDDSLLGGDTLDTSAEAINVLSMSGRIPFTGDPVRPLYTIGSLDPTYKRLAELQYVISQHFFIDRLLDLNNQTRMTLGETQIRNQLRGDSLNPIYTRQISELLQRLITRTFNILFRKGYLGVIKGSVEETEALRAGLTPRLIPDTVAARIVKGQNVYEIEYISPAIRIMQAQELQGATTALELMGGIATVNPEALDVVDFDRLTKRIMQLVGAPQEVVRAFTDVANMRTSRAQAQQAQAQMEAERLQSETARNMAQASTIAQKQPLNGMSA